MPAHSPAPDRHLFNPADGQSRGPRPFASPEQIEAALDRADGARAAWSRATVDERAVVLREVAAVLRRERVALAAMITLEMGKPIAEAEAEIDKSAWNCEYVAEQAPAWLSDHNVPTPAQSSYVAHRPLGTVLAILPWNFPVWQIFRCAVSALMAGNTFLLKPAPNVPDCAAAVAELLAAAGVPDGVFQSLDVPVPIIGELISDRRVSMVAFTGSPAAGAAVAARAGAACKKSILELGGSDAFIVLADADLEAAVAAAVKGRFANCGQVCLAAKRFIVVDAVREEFEQRFAAAIGALQVGDPSDRTTQMGPMAREDLRAALERQIQDSVAQGARLLTGGHRFEHAGYYHAPTLLSAVTAQMPVAREETFGPVAPIMPARDASHALKIANDSRYGLAAVVWSRDRTQAEQLAERLEVGSVFINSVTASDPRLPVGGVKLSGYGRELGSAGIRELVNLQSVWIGS